MTIRLITLLALILVGCSTRTTSPDTNTEATPANEAIYQKWMESHEERSGDLQTYHDPSFVFPPARGREGFTIVRSGEFVWHRIAPTDGNMDVPARWRFADGSTTVIIVSDPATGRDTDRITIVSVAPTVLKAKVEAL